jgi:hypothetical protein
MKDHANAKSDFRLDSEELRVVYNKKLKTRLAFAVMLKFFQLKRKYPDNIKNIPVEMISTLAYQLGVSEKSIKKFQWNGRSAERFRDGLRAFLEFRKPTVSDGESLMQWLIKNHLKNVPTTEQCREFATQYLHQQKIESFTQKEFDRYLRTAQAQFEKEFFTEICNNLPVNTLQQFNELVLEETDDKDSDSDPKDLKDKPIKLSNLKKNIGEAKLKNVKNTILIREYLKNVKLPNEILKKFPQKLLTKYYRRIMAEYPSHIREHDKLRLSAMMSIFCYVRLQFFIDNSADLLLQLIHKVRTHSENSIKKRIISEVTCVNGKFDILCKLSSIASEKPQGVIEKEICPSVSQETLSNLSVELKSRGKWYQTELKNKMRSLYTHGHRRLLLTLLESFYFCSNHAEEEPLLEAILFIIKNQNNLATYKNDIEKIPMKDVYKMNGNKLFRNQPLDNKIFP